MIRICVFIFNFLMKLRFKHVTDVPGEIRQYETDDDGKQRRVSMENSKTGTKESLDSLSLPNQNTILMNIKWYFTKYVKNTMKFI